MTYTFKLARRLALSRIVPASALLLTVGCGGGEPLASDPSELGPSSGSVTNVVLTPRTPNTIINRAVQFAVFELLASGDTVATSDVEWSASGGSISASGIFLSSEAGSFRVVGRAKGRNKADTTVVIVTPTPTLDRITLSPDSIDVAAGTTQQFAATAHMSDGSSSAAAATFTATGGTVTTSGLFTAGGTAGTYRVIATLDGKADTSKVVVGAASSALYANQPLNAVRLADRPFSAIAEDGWSASIVERLGIVSDVAAPQSNPSVGRVRYPAGFRGGTEPIRVSKELGIGKTTLYVSFWVKYSSNWVGHPGSGVNKIFHIWIAGRNRVYLSAQGTNSGGLTPQVRLQDIISHDGFENLSPNLATDVRIVRGRWQRWELLLKSNTSGSANGTVEWWIDGRKVGSYGGIQFVGSSESRDWELLQLAPTWGGMDGTVPADQWFDVDHVYASGRSS